MNRIDRSHLERLIAFAPRLETEPAYTEFNGSEYEYSEHVEEFFARIGNFYDYGYSVEDYEAFERRPEAVGDFPQSAGIDDCLMMLIKIQTAERFCEGAWVAAIQSRRVTAILERLGVLLDEKEDRP